MTYMVLWAVFMVFQVGDEIGGLKFIEIFILKNIYVNI